jgi:hypothetical protein
LAFGEVARWLNFSSGNCANVNHRECVTAGAMRGRNANRNTRATRATEPIPRTALQMPALIAFPLLLHLAHLAGD